MSKPKRGGKQRASRRLPSRGARFYLAEVKRGRLTLEQLQEMKQLQETDAMFVGALGLEVAQAFGGAAPHGVTQDALHRHYNAVCEAITLLCREHPLVSG